MWRHTSVATTLPHAEHVFVAVNLDSSDVCWRWDIAKAPIPTNQFYWPKQYTRHRCGAFGTQETAPDCLRPLIYVSLPKMAVVFQGFNRLRFFTQPSSWGLPGNAGDWTWDLLHVLHCWASTLPYFPFLEEFLLSHKITSHCLETEVITSMLPTEVYLKPSLVCKLLKLSFHKLQTRQ